MNSLDQFYTGTSVARKCYRAVMRRMDGAVDNPYFIEPSAGDGVFFDLLPPYHRVGIDLAPRHKSVQEANFLKWRCGKGKRENRIVIGNPPFGKRGALAVEFIRHAAALADTIAFILPMCFQKYGMQRKLPSDLRLVLNEVIPRESFRFPDGRPYAVNTALQVWTRRNVGADSRLRSPDPVAHKDFKLYQYNNTEDALKVFDNPFAFAVPCQGWQDYRRREKTAAACEKNKQWMLIQAGGAALKRLWEIDYDALAMRYSTMVPGFRKNDLVREYCNA